MDYIPSPADISKFVKADLDDLVRQLTFDEKASLLSVRPCDHDAASKLKLPTQGPTWWTTADIPRLGIPHFKCTDGPVRTTSHPHSNTR
jgi:hypothetical protein